MKLTMKLIEIKKEIDTEDLQKLQTITELMYTKLYNKKRKEICYYE